MQLIQVLKQAYLDGFKFAMALNHQQSYMSKIETTDDEVFYFNAAVRANMNADRISNRYWPHWPPSKEMFLVPVFAIGKYYADRRYARRIQRRELSNEV